MRRVSLGRLDRKSETFILVNRLGETHLFEILHSRFVFCVRLGDPHKVPFFHLSLKKPAIYRVVRQGCAIASNSPPFPKFPNPPPRDSPHFPPFLLQIQVPADSCSAPPSLANA